MDELSGVLLEMEHKRPAQPLDQRLTGSLLGTGRTYVRQRWQPKFPKGPAQPVDQRLTGRPLGTGGTYA